MLATTAYAEHGQPLPGTHEELVCGYVASLDGLLDEFGLANGFSDERLNRALVRAESSVQNARSAALVPDLTSSLRVLRAAMRELEKGAAVPVSGSGFADDLASLGSFFAEIFTEDLIALTDERELASSAAIEDAMSDFEDGLVARNLGLWEVGVSDFLRAVRTIERELVIGVPCQP